MVVAVFKRHRGLILFVLGIIALFFIFYALRSALIPFALGLVLAYILLPIMTWVENKLPRPGKWRQTKRISIIVFTFIIIAAIVVVFVFYFVNAIVSAFTMLLGNAPDYISSALYTLQRWTEDLREQFPPEAQQQINDFSREAAAALGNAIRGAFLTGVSVIPNTFSLIFGFAALPIFLFYFLKDSEKLERGFYGAFSPWVAEHVRNIISIIEAVLGRYIRAQMVLGAIVAYLTFIGLWILSMIFDQENMWSFAPALALFAGITELIPTIGPWIGGAVAVIVTLAVAPDIVIWVALLFLIVQLLENNLLVPRIQGGYLRIHPAVAIMLLVLGAYIAGFWGLILAVPLTATAVEIYKYIHRSARAEATSDSLPTELPESPH
jgi:predicted PurR-regulated permease PerM